MWPAVWALQAPKGIDILSQEPTSKMPYRAGRIQVRTLRIDIALGYPGGHSRVPRVLI